MPSAIAARPTNRLASANHLGEGNKRFLFILGFIGAGIAEFFTGQDVGYWLQLWLEDSGWSDPLEIHTARRIATVFVPLLIAVWAAGSTAWKMVKQYKAGATLTELNKPVGVVKAAIADGSLASLTTSPTALTLEGVTVLAPPVVVPELGAKAVEQAEAQKG